MKTTRPSDRAAILAVIDPDSQAAGTYNSAWVDMAAFGSIMAVISVGDMGASATIDAKIEQATDASGTGAKDVTGAAITQMTQAGSDNDKQAVIELWGSDLDLNNAFRHVRVSLTVATAACDAAVAVLGFDPRYGPASDSDLASVAEIVTA